MSRMNFASAACVVGASLLCGGASAQLPELGVRHHHHHRHYHSDVVAPTRALSPADAARAARAARAAASSRVTVSPDNQIVVELAPEDTTAANLFDLNGRTLIFNPDGQGGYSRSVRPLAWEDDIGERVADGAEVELRSFMFDFAGRRWGSFFVGENGLITFGGRQSASWRDDISFFSARMSEIAKKFVTRPTVAPLFKPFLGKEWGGRSYPSATYVKRGPDQAVVTWSTAEPFFYVHGLPPDTPSRFQAILGADGSVRLSFRDVDFGDGIVGLFPDDEVTKGSLIANVPDPTNSELPGHLDLLDVSIYDTNADALIVEWTMRDDVPSPPSGTTWSYRLYFDTDEPYFHGDWGADVDFSWSVDVATDEVRTSRGRRLPTSDASRIALLVEDERVRGIAASIKPDVAQFTDGRFVQGNWNTRSAPVALPDAAPPVDLSRSASSFSKRQSEVFHYRGAPATTSIACRVIDALGDGFDVFSFHTETRVDLQVSPTDVFPNYGNARAKGTGSRWDAGVPCGEGRLKAVFARPVWIESFFVADHGRHSRHGHGHRFDEGLALFAHEFAHVWTANASYSRKGQRERLFGDACRCHWRREMHLPAAFPWSPKAQGPQSIMGATYWRDNGDGTFTELYDGYYWGGFSWLDLYMMGLAETREVPGTLILRNLQPVNEDEPWGPHTADKEVVSIEQVISAEGPRIPAAASSQKEFNAAFVYLVEPGRSPDPDMVRLHAEHRGKVVEHWSHITGGRSRITTSIPGRSDPEPEPDPDPEPPPPTDGSCVANAETLCLHDGRYELRAEWRTPDGESGPAPVVPMATKDSGLFRFFEEDNWEILIKVLDGCALNGHHWVYGASTTDLGYSIRVTDTKTGDFKVYRNQPGRPAPAITDDKAFPGACGEGAAAATGSALPVLGGAPGVELTPASLIAASGSGCTGTGTSLCLADGRFEVKVDWSTTDGQEGPARTVPGGTNNSGLFWFFGADNWEMLIKVLDGCAINGRHWVYSAAATDLGLDITVTDTRTGAAWRHAKEPGPPAPAITASDAFPDSCRPPDAEPVPVDILDSSLRAAIEAALGVPSGARVTRADMRKLVGVLEARRAGVKNLQGLEFATNLSGLFLDYNEIADLSPLAGLTRLESLSLVGNVIADVSPLTGLTSLALLFLADNEIADVSPLVDLPNLTLLGLRGNPLDRASLDIHIPALLARGVDVHFDDSASNGS